MTDVGGGYIDIEKENTKVTQENTEATKAAAAAVAKLQASFTQGPAANGAPVATMTGW